MFETALLCLALTVYHEARGEPAMGQFAVARVVLNRAGGRLGAVCPTVLKSNQFSWTITRVTPVKGGYRLLPSGVPREQEAWSYAVRIARTALTVHSLPDFSRGATHYHEVSLRPGWSRKLSKVAVIGNHIFYREG